MSQVVPLVFLALLLTAPGLATDDPPAFHNPMLRKRVDPEMPALFRNSLVEGRVSLEVTIGKDGSVVKAETRSCVTRRPGEKEFLIEPKKQCVPFEQAAQKAVLQWRYTPATQGGEPIECLATVAIDFTR